MHIIILLSLALVSSFSFAGDTSPDMPAARILASGTDSTSEENLIQEGRTHSLRSDLLRSAIGTTVGGIVGAGIGGIMAISFGGDYDTHSFPNNSFYLSSYVGAGALAALTSATILHFSKDRDISYWQLASYSMLPPLILVMPLSVHASVQDREELVKAAWVATLASVGISTFWNVFVYRIYPPRSNDGMTIHFGKPYVGINTVQTARDSQLSFGIRLIEVHF